MEQFADYGHALLALVIMAVLAQVLNAMTGIKKGKNKMIPGEGYTPDLSNPGYLLDRAYMNGVENLGIVAVVVFAAILAGAAPLWVNILASVILIARLAFTGIYMRGMGGGYGGLRTGMAVLSSIGVMGLAILTLFSVL